MVNTGVQGTRDSQQTVVRAGAVLQGLFALQPGSLSKLVDESAD